MEASCPWLSEHMAWKVSIPGDSHLQTPETLCTFPAFFMDEAVAALREQCAQKCARTVRRGGVGARIGEITHSVAHLALF
jgi:hypothetical protein